MHSSTITAAASQPPLLTVPSASLKSLLSLPLLPLPLLPFPLQVCQPLRLNHPLKKTFAFSERSAKPTTVQYGACHGPIRATVHFLLRVPMTTKSRSGRLPPSPPPLPPPLRLPLPRWERLKQPQVQRQQADHGHVWPSIRTARLPMQSNGHQSMRLVGLHWHRLARMACCVCCWRLRPRQADGHGLHRQSQLIRDTRLRRVSPGHRCRLWRLDRVGLQSVLRRVGVITVCDCFDMMLRRVRLWRSASFRDMETGFGMLHFVRLRQCLVASCWCLGRRIRV